MSQTVRVAGVQMDVAFANPQENLRRMSDYIAETAGQGAVLTVFPECALTGYCFDSIDEARGVAETVPGPGTEQITSVCVRLNTHVAFGMLETDGNRMFNACVLVGPQGVVATYRKIHLPYLGIDRFVTPGDQPFGVHDIGPLRVGMHICYDGAFPEAARVMALDGADLIALPTNWPPGAECTADFVTNTRALENNVYFMAIDRIGAERGFAFIGKSKICDPAGRELAFANHTEAEVLYADVDLEYARRKRIVRVPDKHIIDRFNDRRPEMYGRILEK